MRPPRGRQTPSRALELADHLPQPLSGRGLLTVGGPSSLGKLFGNLLEINFQVMDKDVVHPDLSAFGYRDGRL
jgi:hypothetical protein